MSQSRRIRSSEHLYTAARFTIERRTIQLANGSNHSREVIQHPGAVVILPLVDDDHVCLIRNYRMAIDVELLELPAGTLEPPEPPIETAQRELIEETGYRCESIEPLGEFYMSPGILNEKMYAFVARGLTAGEQALEEGEQIQTQVMSFAEIDSLLRAGKLQDSKTLSALLLFQRKTQN
ncbi:MAG: NUDIX hydrolase [Planctomycetota bacterium]